MWGGISLLFWFAFPWWWVVVSVFSWSVGHLYVFFGKMSSRVLCPFLNWIPWFFGVELCKFFIYFGYEPLLRYVICKCLPPFSRLSFCFVDGFLCYAEAFYFSQVYLLILREGVQEGQREKERDRTPSRLRAVSTEPDAGLELTTCEITTRAEVRWSTSWATQAPQVLCRV